MSITIGKTYTFVQPPVDATCADASCEMDAADLIFPWINLLGKRVIVTETGHTYAGHPAVKVTYGPVDWHPRVAVRLTDEQVKVLGILTGTAPTGYMVIGQVWAVDGGAPVAATEPDLDALPWGWMAPVEMPQQRTEIIPARCLKDPAVDLDEKRREDRLRKLATVHKLKLRKMRGSLSGHSTGPYLLVGDRFGINAVAGDPRWRIGVSLDEVEAALHKQRERQA